MVSSKAITLLPFFVGLFFSFTTLVASAEVALEHITNLTVNEVSAGEAPTNFEAYFTIPSTGFSNMSLTESNYITFVINVDDGPEQFVATEYCEQLPASFASDHNISWNETFPVGFEIWNVYVFEYTTSDCSGTATGLVSIMYDDQGADIWTIVEAPPEEGGGGTDLGEMITNANVQFSSTTGFNIPGVASWAGDNLIKLFIGSGLNIIYHLRYWIVALIVIGAILLFAYRAFKFFRH